jgi:hypothetical protein
MTRTIKVERILTPKDRLYITKNTNDRLIYGVLAFAGIKMSRSSRPVYSVEEEIHIKIELSPSKEPTK